MIASTAPEEPTTDDDSPHNESCVAIEELDDRCPDLGEKNKCYKCETHHPDSELRVCIYCVNQKKEIVVVNTGNYLILEDADLLKRLLCGNCKDKTRCRIATNPTGNHLTINFVILKHLTDFNLQYYRYLARYDKLDVHPHQAALYKFREDYAFAKTEEVRKSVLVKVEDYVKSSNFEERTTCDVIEVITIDDED